MQTRNAVGNLIKRYKAVLHKCHILNKLGALTLASGLLLSPMLLGSAHALIINPAGTTVNNMEATSSNPNLENFGIISGGKAYNAFGTTVYAGMYGSSAGNTNFNFHNTGEITVNKSGVDFVYGMFAFAGGDGSHIFSNDGTITVSGNDIVCGMFAYASGDGSHILSNGGTITVSGTGNSVYGMSATTLDNGSHRLSNDGTITVSGTDNAYGMSAHTQDDGSHSLSNGGTIMVNGDTGVIGMYAHAQNDGSHTFSNGGTITVSGTDYVYGMYADTNGDGSHTLNNDGTITVSGASSIYGMNVVGRGMHHLSNTGYISASATAGRAYEAYGQNDYTVGTWATTLRNLSTTGTVFGGETPFGGTAPTVNLAQSTLVFRPQVTARGVELGQDYDLTNLVVIDGTAVPTQLGAITAEVPFLKAVVTGGTTTDSTKVRLESNINEHTTPGSASMLQALAQVQGQFDNVSKALRNSLVGLYTQAYVKAATSESGANAGSELMPEQAWQVFFNPYVSSTANTELDFHGSNVGLTGGLNYRVSEQFSLGAHVDFNAGTFYGDIVDTSSKSTSFAFGLHAAYHITPEWYARAQLSASMQQHDNDYKTGTLTPITAQTNAHSTAYYANVSTGYIWNFGQNHSLTSEVGLSYMNLHAFSYDINWNGPGATGGVYDFSYDDSNYSALYAHITMDWRSEFQVSDDNSIALLAGLGLRQKLTSEDIETSMKAFSATYTTSTTEDPTSFLASAGIEWNINDFSLALTYNGEYGGKQSTHGGSVMARIEF